MLRFYKRIVMLSSTYVLYMALVVMISIHLVFMYLLTAVFIWLKILRGRGVVYLFTCYPPSIYANLVDGKK